MEITIHLRAPKQVADELFGYREGLCSFVQGRTALLKTAPLTGVEAAALTRFGRVGGWRKIGVINPVREVLWGRGLRFSMVV